MAEEYRLVGVVEQMIGSVEGWCVSYIKPDGGFHHHMFPATIFKTYADQFGMDVDADFDEILEIVLHERFAGDDDPADAIEPRGMLRALNDGRNKNGRIMRRRADRGKQAVEITGIGIGGIRNQLHKDRRKGSEDLLARLTRLERARGIGTGAARIGGPDRSDQGAEGPDRRDVTAAGSAERPDREEEPGAGPVQGASS